LRNCRGVGAASGNISATPACGNAPGRLISRSMASPRHVLGVISVLLAACGSEPRPPKPPSAFEVFPNLPLPPAAQFVSQSGSEDALQIRFLSAARPDGVAGYYRAVLSTGKWRLISDVSKPDGSVALYAEQDGPPMWVRMWPTSDKQGTMIELTGAVVAKKSDSLKVDTSRAKAPGKKAK
jgi:hypothetical protein